MNTLNLLTTLALITLAFVLAGIGYSNGRRKAKRLYMARMRKMRDKQNSQQ